MYEQSLVKTVEPVKKTTISRLNKGKKWKYGYDKEHDIIEEDDKYSVYIKKNKDVLPWKDFNKNMAVSVEYNLQY